MNIFRKIIAAIDKWAEEPPLPVSYTYSKQERKHVRIDPISPCCLQHMVQKHNPDTPDRIFVCPCRNEFRWAL